MADTFGDSIEEVKRLEKKLLGYAPYGGELEAERTLDLEPRDYVDLAYADLLNLYERAQKIITTTERGVFAMKSEEGAKAEAAPAPEVTKATQAVESRLREMTTETLKSAEEVAREPIAPEKAPPAPEAAPEPQKMEIEFEHRPAEKEIELEREKAPEGLEGERPMPPKEAGRAAAPPVAEGMKAAPELERPAGPEMAPEEKRIIVAVPPALKESPDNAVSRRYDQMEEQIRAAVGEKADETTLKKKMLELTKELFKEKSATRRNEIKLQITVLKNMLSGAPGRAAGARRGKGADETHQKLFETMLAAQQGELAHTKDDIIGSYNRQIATIRKKFYADMGMTEDAARRKQIFDSFAFSVTSLVEQLPEVLAKYQDFTVKKHATEMEKLRDSLEAGEKATMKAVDERLDYIKAKYGQEFSPVRGIIAHEIDTLIEVAGAEVFRKEAVPGEKREETEAKQYETVKDINETDEGTLLYYLHTKDADYYKMYERNQISKAEAIFKAKELMAREKGLSDATVRKYFTHTEG